MSDTAVFRLIRGDRLTPLARTLKQGGAAVDLTGATVEFKLVKEDNTVVQDWTSTGVTIVDAEAGEVQYAFSDANWTAMASEDVFYYWYRLVSGGLYTTFPRDGRSGRIEVYEAG